MNHPNLPHWFRLRDRARVRGEGWCEFCRNHRPSNLHHRTYQRWGCEKLEDVMYVCRACHKAIEGIDRTHHRLLVKPGSLADRGDTGRGMTPAWAEYLETVQIRLDVYEESIE